MERRPDSRGSAWLAKLALAAVSTLLTLGAAELVVRAVGVDLVTDKKLRFHPVLGWTSDPAWPLFDHINTQGFRHHVEPENPEGRRRLVILGDSFTFGGAYPFERTYAGRLDKWLGGGEKGERWDVVNLASGGFGTGQELLALRHYGLDFEPDAVVLQIFPYNDLCNNNIRQAHTCSFLDYHRPYFVADGDRLRLTHLHPSRARIRRGSRLFGLLELRLRWGFPASWKGITEDPSSRVGVLLEETRAAGLQLVSNHYTLVPDADQPDLIRAGWEVTERAVQEIAALTAEREIPLIGVVIPYMNTFIDGWSPLEPPDHPPLVADYGTRKSEEILRAAGARVISMRTRILAGDKPPHEYFYPHGNLNDKHLNGRGHYAVAGWIVDELRALGLSRRQTPEARNRLCDEDLAAFGRRLRALPPEILAEPDAAGQLANLVDIAGEAVRTCRTEVAGEMLARLRERLESDSYLQDDAEVRQELLDEANARLEAVRSSRCFACAGQE